MYIPSRINIKLAGRCVTIGRQVVEVLQETLLRVCKS